MLNQSQTSLFNSLPNGVEHFKQVLTEDEQADFVDLCRQVVAHSPLIVPTMLDGTPLKLKLTSCGACGWIGDRHGYRYAQKHPATRRRWAKMPPKLRLFAKEMGEKVDWIFKPDTCLINFYDQPASRLGLHQDISEKDLSHIIITLSLGDSCIFAVREENASDNRRRVMRVRLDSGDCIVMHRSGRLLYHGVEKIIHGSSNLLKQNGRISLTFRKAL